jgi:hypothetical protein
VLDLLDQAIERLPDELRASRWLLKERDEFLERTQREADDILAAARGQAARQRNEADDFCDKRLAQMETVLEKTMSIISSGRAKLRGPAGEGHPPAAAARAGVNGHGHPDDDPEPDSRFFDQDRQ